MLKLGVEQERRSPRSESLRLSGGGERASVKSKRREKKTELVEQEGG